jgi:hypothetical protein
MYLPTTNTLAWSTNGAEGMRLDSSGNVGIGTSSPQQKFVVSNSGAAGVEVSPTGGSQGGTYLQAYNRSGTAFVPTEIIASKIGFYTGTSPAFAALIDSSGNVGIGTSSPAGKLNVSNGGAAGFEFFTNAPGGGVGTYVQSFNRSSGAFVETHYYAASHVWRTNASVTSMTLDSSGNVGIGTSSPAVKLDVNGITGWQGSTTGIAGSIAGASSGITGGGNLRVLANTTQAANVGGALTLGGYYTSTTLSVDFGAILGAKENSTAGDAAGYLAFGTRPAGGNMAERLRITSAGNVGVGTTNAAQKFVVSNGGAAGLEVEPAGLDTGPYLQGYNRSTAVYVPITTLSSYIAFRTGASPTESARIDSSGNLLVGKTALSDTSVGFQTTSGGRVACGMASGDAYVLYSTAASAYRFYVTNAGVINATSTTITAISDVRLKENIRDLDDGLNAVMALKPRKFDWKAGKGKDKKDDRGWIAQEFEQVFPDMIHEWLDPAPEGEEPYKAVNADLIPMLVKAIQEQQAIIQSLTDRITQLEAK